jgi:hexosaminidase
VKWEAPCVEIKDRPRFAWRGMLLDVSRHFFTKQEVEQILDALAMHKINTYCTGIWWTTTAGASRSKNIRA